MKPVFQMKPVFLVKSVFLYRENISKAVFLP